MQTSIRSKLIPIIMTMGNKNIFNILQLAGGTFPGGGFSQSWGLETYVEKGIVTDVHTLKEFTDVYMNSVLARAEVPLVIGVMKALSAGDHDRLEELENLSLASKLTKESREAALKMGNAFMRILSESLEDHKLADLYKKFKKKGITYPTAYGIVISNLDITEKDAASAYIFSSVNAIIQSAVKLIPLGNTEAQKVLYELGGAMDRAADKAFDMDPDDIVTFCPGLDIAGMEHETLKVRLYMT